MVNVTKKWIRENVKTLWCFGGQIRKEDVLGSYCGNVPRGGYETMLTGEGKGRVEERMTKEKFHILIPGYGWADCFGFFESNDFEEVS